MHVIIVHRNSDMHRTGHGACVPQGASTMLDLIMLAIGVGFFALSVAYVYACERL
jgi:hypothetical protein